jgi:hypothetical protein
MRTSIKRTNSIQSYPKHPFYVVLIQDMSSIVYENRSVIKGSQQIN